MNKIVNDITQYCDRVYELFSIVRFDWHGSCIYHVIRHDTVTYLERIMKMKTLSRLAFASFATLLFSMNADSASAQSFGHVDRLATKLQGQSRELYNEFRLHYRHSTHYRHLMSDAAKIYNESKHIHDVVHRGGLNHLAQDLKDIDRAYHHLEGLVRHIERDARRGIGHVDGRTGHVKRQMRQMKDTIHHLREDVGRSSRKTSSRLPR